jgi:hypothetical protein
VRDEIKKVRAEERELRVGCGILFPDRINTANTAYPAVGSPIAAPSLREPTGGLQAALADGKAARWGRGPAWGPAS